MNRITRHAMVAAGAVAILSGALVGINAGTASAADVAHCDTGERKVYGANPDPTVKAYGCGFDNHDTQGGPYTVHIADMARTQYRRVPPPLGPWRATGTRHVKNVTMTCQASTINNGIVTFTECGPGRQ